MPRILLIEDEDSIDVYKRQFIYREFGREPWMSDPAAVRDALRKYYFETEEEDEDETVE